MDIITNARGTLAQLTPDGGGGLSISGQGINDELIDLPGFTTCAGHFAQLTVLPPFVHAVRDSNASVCMGSRDSVGSGPCDPYGHNSQLSEGFYGDLNSGFFLAC